MNRDFKGIWIPREIWLADGLTAAEKVLWAEIHSLYDSEKCGCYASNEYLANFMGVRERTVRDSLCKFRQLKLIEDVSFNGRERVIKALQPDSEFECRLAEWRKSAMLTGENPPCCVAEKCTPPLYIGTSIVTSLETPPIPPQNPEPPKTENAAKAAEVDLNPSSKPKRKKWEFPAIVREVANLMIDSLSRVKPNYLPPKNLTAFLTEIDFLLRLDKRDPQKIMDVFNWALADLFWVDKLFKPNPAKYLREKYDQLEMKMMAKPAEKKANLSLKDQVEKHFKNHSRYSDAECIITDEAVAFVRGNKHQQIKFKEWGFLDQFDSMLRSFGIINPLRGSRG